MADTRLIRAAFLQRSRIPGALLKVDGIDEEIFVSTVTSGIRGKLTKLMLRSEMDLGESIPSAQAEPLAPPPDTAPAEAGANAVDAPGPNDKRNRIIIRLTAAALAEIGPEIVIDATRNPTTKERIFLPDDLEWVSVLPFKTIDAIVNAALEHSGMTVTDEEEARDFSAAPPRSDSGSGSPDGGDAQSQR